MQRQIVSGRIVQQSSRCAPSHRSCTRIHMPHSLHWCAHPTCPTPSTPRSCLRYTRRIRRHHAAPNSCLCRPLDDQHARRPPARPRLSACLPLARPSSSVRHSSLAPQTIMSDRSSAYTATASASNRHNSDGAISSKPRLVLGHKRSPPRRARSHMRPFNHHAQRARRSPDETFPPLNRHLDGSSSPPSSAIDKTTHLLRHPCPCPAFPRLLLPSACVHQRRRPTTPPVQLGAAAAALPFQRSLDRHSN